MLHAAPAGLKLKANFVRSKDAFPPDGEDTAIGRVVCVPKISPTFGEVPPGA